jgi:hypothetical protein
MTVLVEARHALCGTALCPCHRRLQPSPVSAACAALPPQMEQVLFVHKDLDVFRIPPRVGASGWRSGEWRVADRIFSGRVRVVAAGEALEIRLEDPQT